MAGLLDYLALLKPRQRAQWSIGIYAGQSPMAMAPHPAVGSHAALTHASLGAVKADGVADPFMIRHGSEWLMFFEIENRRSGRGEIGLARSADALAWRFDDIVLKEPFHLSYPHVFEFEGGHYMLPECSASGALRLYKAQSFPRAWQLHVELLKGDFADATPFRHDGRWWMIALEGFRQADAMVLYYSDRLEGPWHPHAGNPISSNNRRTARPAGRMINDGNQLVRLTQDCETRYGRAVRAYVIEELTPDTYKERPVFEDERFVLAAAGHGWNASGMHHMDAHRVGPDEWIACVDGRRTVWTWPLWDRLIARWPVGSE